MKSLKIIILCGLGGAVLFGVFSLIFYFGDWERLGIVTAFGAFVGLVGAPEFEPSRLLKNPPFPASRLFGRQNLFQDKILEKIAFKSASE